MYNPFKNLSDSLRNDALGWSGRKVAAYILTFCFVMLNYAYYRHLRETGDFSLFIKVICIDLAGIAFFLGLVTVANLIELRNGKSSSVKETTTVEKEVVVNDPKVDEKVS